ncbi:MAG: hypothetical protein ACOC0Y_01615, partial [Spirochaetota bacterium]
PHRRAQRVSPCDRLGSLPRRSRIATVGSGWGAGMIVDGGLLIDEGANVRASHELIYGNTIHAWNAGGAGLAVDGPRTTDQATTEISLSTIADNVSISDLHRGNGSIVEDGSEVIASNCVFWSNGGQYVDVYLANDSTLAPTDSQYEFGYDPYGDLAVDGCEVRDPQFVDPDSSDYRTENASGRGVYLD